MRDSSNRFASRSSSWAALNSAFAFRIAISRDSFARPNRRDFMVARLAILEDATITAKKKQPRIPRNLFAPPSRERKRMEAGNTRNAQNASDRLCEGAKTVALPPAIPQRTIAV